MSAPILTGVRGTKSFHNLRGPIAAPGVLPDFSGGAYPLLIGTVTGKNNVRFTLESGHSGTGREMSAFDPKRTSCASLIAMKFEVARLWDSPFD